MTAKMKHEYACDRCQLTELVPVTIDVGVVSARPPDLWIEVITTKRWSDGKSSGDSRRIFHMCRPCGEELAEFMHVELGGEA